MDGETESSTPNEAPGAPELGKEVRPPVAHTPKPKRTGPVFKADDPVPNAVPQLVRSTPLTQAAPEPTEPSGLPVDDIDEPEDDTPVLDEHQARIEYLRSLREQKPKKKRGKWVVLLILLLLAAGAGGYYYFVMRDSQAGQKTHAKQQPTTTEDTTPVATDEEQGPAKLTQYTSTAFPLSLKHPSDWTPAEQGGVLTVTSPVVKLTDASGQTVDARMVVTVRAKQDKPAEFTTGPVLAVLDSDKITYDHPAITQQGLAYITYAQYSTASVKGAMNGIYITNDYGYKYKQVVPVGDIAKLNPLVEVTFVSCVDAECAATTQTPLAVSSTAWKLDTINRPVVEDLLKSFTFN